MPRDKFLFSFGQVEKYLFAIIVLFYDIGFYYRSHDRDEGKTVSLFYVSWPWWR